MITTMDQKITTMNRKITAMNQKVTALNWSHLQIFTQLALTCVRSIFDHLRMKFWAVCPFLHIFVSEYDI